MSKTKIEPKTYTQWKLNEYAEKLITVAHNSLVMEEKRVGKRCYETFGEWKATHSNHPVAKVNYPEDEYVIVISTYKSYFNKFAADDDELV